jgi:hypothetical protein
VLDAGRALAHGSPAAIAAATPGTIRATRERPGAEAAARAWRRGTTWRVWGPDTDTTDVREADRIEPDLQDAVTVAALARELDPAPTEAGTA